MIIFYYKFFISIALSVIVFFMTIRQYFINDFGSKSPKKFFFGLLILFRIIPFIIIYILFGLDTHSDVPIFYQSAIGALKGGFVYKDFQTVYSPLFPYVSAILLPIWNDAKAIVLTMIGIEAFAIYLTMSSARSIDRFYKMAIYFALPSGFVFSVIGGQEDIWMWCMLALILYYQKGFSNLFLIGVLLGLGLLITKFLFLLLFLPVLLYHKKWGPIFGGLLLVGVSSCFILYTQTGWGFLAPINEANSPRSPNLWSLVHTVSNGSTPFGPSYLNWFGLITILTYSIYLALKYRSKLDFQVYIQGIFCQLFIWLMLIQQSSYANYAFVFMLPFLFFVDLKSKFDLAVLLILNILLVIQPTFWWSNGQFRIQQISELANPIYFFGFLMEFMIITGLFWMMIRVGEQMKRFSQPA